MIIYPLEDGLSVTNKNKMQGRNILRRIYNKIFHPKINVGTKSLPIEMGENSTFKGKVDKRHPDSRIVIGKDCLIYGFLVTNTSSSFIKIGNDTFIGGGTIIESACSIIIGNNVLISHQCIIQDSDNHSTKFSLRKKDVADWKNGQYHDWDVTPKKEVIIKNGAWLGARAIILKGITIGEGSIVGAGSVVTKNVPDWTIVGGNPARIIRTISENER